MNIEIEKKYLCKNNDDLMSFISKNKKISLQEIKQIYIISNDEEEVRYRKTTIDKKSTFVRTAKKGNGLVREEIETDVTSFEYEALRSYLFAFEPISKKRITVEYDSKLLEIDFFENSILDNLVLLEVEFSSLKEAESFEDLTSLPFIIEDVTDKKDFKNKNLWKKLNC